MKPHNFLIPATVFSAGFALAWFIVPDARPTALGQSEQNVKSGRSSKSSVRSHEARESSKRRASVDRLLAISEAGELKLEGIAEADFLPLLTELLKRANTSDSSSFDDYLIGNLMYGWYEANPDAALSWVLEMENQKVANGLLSNIIDNVADKDLNAAIALAESHGAAQGRDLEMSFSMWEKLGEVDAETFAHVFGCFQNRSGSSGIMSMRFAEDFDFRNTLDKLTETKAGLEQGAYLSAIPLNLLSEWASRDWNAAWEWALSGKNSDFKDFPKIVNEAAIHASMKQIAGYAAQIASLPNRTAEENFIDAENILSNRPIPELVPQFLSQMTGDRQENLNGILSASFASGGAYSDATRQNLLSLMTPAERVTAFESDAMQKCKSYFNRETNTTLLRRLGHGDEEIARMLDSAPKK